MGMIAPIVGILIFKLFKFSIFSIKETFQFLLLEPGFRTLSAALSISLLLNAGLFTIYINTYRDETAKGIFFTTLFYGLIILSIKTFL